MDDNDDQSVKLKHANRHAAQQAPRTHFWCGCDRNHVTLSGKHRNCSECGYKLRRTYKKLKRITPPL